MVRGKIFDLTIIENDRGGEPIQSRKEDGVDLST